MKRLFAETDDSAETLFMYARTNAPAMRIARAELRAAISAVDAEIANLYPEISASASLSWVDPVWTFRWGASFVQSLFQGMRKTTAVDAAVVAMRKAEVNTVAAERQLALELSLRCAERDNAREAVIRSRQSMKEAKENLALSRSRYEIGEADRVDFSEAVSAYSEALGACVSAYYASQRAEAAFFPLIGNYPVYDEGVVLTEGK
jgi:outer membrane protein TolC